MRGQAKMAGAVRARIVGVASTALLGLGVLAVPASAEVRDIGLACPDGWAVAFTDVPSDNVHARAVECAAAWGIAHGTGDGVYSPTQSVTRAQMATFIARLLFGAGVPLDPDAPDAFYDDDGSVHERSINALAEVGIVTGSGEGSYRPGDEVTRAQMATFLVRAFEQGATALPAGPDAFSDDDGNVHEDAIDAAAAAGFAAGTSTGIYRPSAEVRRDAMASFIARTLDKLIDDGFLSPPMSGEPTTPGDDPDAPPPPDGTTTASSEGGDVAAASFSAASLSWYSYGQHTCEGVQQPTAYAPTLSSSGYAAWIPEYIWFLPNGQQVSEWGQWLWSYQGSQWQYFSQDAFYPPDVYTGHVAVRNWVWDYDAGMYWNTWSTTTANILGHGGGQYFCYFNGWGLIGPGL